MQRTKQCLERIAQVREAARDLHSAYLLRARTYRMLLSVQRLVVAEYGADILRPELLVAEKNIDPAMRSVATLTNELLQSSRHLSQRSAAFDRRWQQEWEEVELVLTRLEASLRGLENAD